MSILNEKEAAAWLRLSPRTCQRMRVCGGGPRFLRLRGSIRYRLADLEAWINARIFSNTSQKESEQ